MLSVGIDFGGTNIAAGLVDEEGKILSKKTCKTGADRPADAIIFDMASLILSLISDFGIKKEEVFFCGIAAPGICDTKNGILEYSCNLPSFIDFPIVASLKEKTGLTSIALENDATCAAKGEAEVGAGKGVNSCVCITLGTGVGCGVILNGKPLSGCNPSTAELGHMVIENGGEACSCGRRGCWEAYSSATALCRMTKEEMEKDPQSLMWTLCEGNIENVGGRTAFRAKDKGDKSAEKVISRFVHYLACGLTNVVNIFQPDVLCVGGGVSGEGEGLLAPVREVLEKEQYSRNCKTKTVLKRAELGNDAGIVGAALLWR